MALPTIDTFAPAYDDDVHAAIRVAREESWCASTPMGLMFLDYDDVHALVRDRRFPELGAEALRMEGITEGPLFEWSSIILSNQGDEAHARLRHLVAKAFTPRSVEVLRPRMRAIADELLDRLPPEGCEFVSSFSSPYPVRVISELLGVPEEDADRFHDWSNDLSIAFGSRVAEELPRVEAALVALSDYVDGLIAVRRNDPGPDLLSALIQAEESGDRMTQEELRAMAVVLIFGGEDTTQCQLACALATFAGHHDQWERVATDPAVAVGAAEEVIRFEPAGSGSPRIAEVDVDWREVHIPAGTVVMPSAPAANRDPKAYDDPDRFDIGRTMTQVPLTFGGGPHHCLGAALARAELQEALPILARRLGPVDLDGPVEWRHGSLIRGPQVLPLRYQGVVPA
jgi:cytochrome P450